MDLYPLYVAHVKPHLPEWVRLPLARTWTPISLVADRLGRGFFLWRIRPLPTRMLGPKWRRSRKRAELNLTYVCNMACFNCDRSCQQDPTSDRMSLEQVRQFLDESRARGIRWQEIRVAGGEPTTHPQFLEAVDLLREYRDGSSPSTLLTVWTNGHGAHVKGVLAQLPPDVIVENSAKSTNVQPRFHTFNVAPADLEEYRDADFSNGCRITQRCGIGVTSHGYYPCAAGGSVDHTFGMALGRATLPTSEDGMTEELRKLCSLCGHFKRPTKDLVDGPVMSASWEEAYERSRRSRVESPRLGGQRIP